MHYDGEVVYSELALYAALTQLELSPKAYFVLSDFGVEPLSWPWLYARKRSQYS